MFIGHFAIGYAAKKHAPSVSLGTLFIAAQFLDLLWPLFLLLGIERAEIVPGITVLTPFDFTHYPYTHSLLMALAGGWSLLSFQKGKQNSTHTRTVCGESLGVGFIGTPSRFAIVSR